MIEVDDFLRHHPVHIPSQTDDDEELVQRRIREPRDEDSSRSRGGRGETSPSANRSGFGALSPEEGGCVPHSSSRRRGRRAESAGDVDSHDCDACKQAALRLLDAAPRSSGGLSDRLASKGFDRSVIDDVIQRFVEVNLIDDEEYARETVRYCLAHQYGRRGALNQLRRRGVDPAISTRIVDEAASRGAFDEAAWELGHMVDHRTRGLDAATRRRRFWNAAGRKGHVGDIVGRISRALFDGAA